MIVPPGRPTGWRWEERSGTATDLHAAPWPEPLVRTVWDLHVVRRALVLGSAQPDTDVMGPVLAGSTTLEVTRRRSGGGAVLLDPERSVWLDVFIPHDDPRWDDDIGRAAHWLGDVWRAALIGLGIPVAVHRSGLVTGPFSRLACFAGLGPGELTLVPGDGDRGDRDWSVQPGPKVLGLSQRRTRGGARFQCVAYVGTDVVLGLDEVLVVPADLGGPAALRAALLAATAGLSVSGDELRAAFQRSLSALR